MNKAMPAGRQGFSPALILIVVLVLAVGAAVTYYIVAGSQGQGTMAPPVAKTTATPPPVAVTSPRPSPTPAVAAVTGQADLDNLQKTLDGTNPDSMTTDLNANSADAASF